MLKLKGILVFVSVLFGLWTQVDAGSYSYDYNGSTVLEISLGTPPQGPFLFHWDPLMHKFSHHTPSIGNARFGGPYDPNSSSTFKLITVIGDNEELLGTETFAFKNGPAFKTKEIVVFKTTKQIGEVGLAHGEDGESSFMDRVLADLGGSRTIVLAIRNSTKVETKTSNSGTIVLGDESPSICKTSWTIYPALPHSFIQMTFDVTDIQIGKYHQSKKIPMSFEAESIWLDRESYAAAAKQLGVDQNQEMDCNTKGDIEITAGKLTWTLRPEDYMWKVEEDFCLFDVLPAAAGVIRLPLRFFNRQCLKFDFDKKTIAFAEMA